MKSRSGVPATTLAAAARRVAVPRDYFHGWRRPPVFVPDNILLFVRRSLTELRDGTFLPHYHHRWVLIVPLGGAGEVVVDGRGHRLVPGQLLLVPPLRLHRYARVSHAGLLWLFATFDLPGGAGPVEAATVGTLSREVREALVTALRRWTGTRQTGAAATRLAVELAVVVAAVARRHRPPADNPRQPELELLERIRDWLAARPAAGGGLRELSRHVGLSESRLRAWFRATFGISLGRYLRETRCRQAAQCLREGGVTVAEIAERFGFATAFSFSRTFKAVLGISPRELLPQREGWPRGRPAAGRQAAAAPTPGRNG